MKSVKINQQIVNKLNSLNLTISTCESMTGGMVANSLVQAENASKCFLGGFVSYSAFSKNKFAKVSQKTIETYGTVSPECAREMVNGTQLSFNSDISISVTGNASFINPIEKKQSGMAYVDIKVFDKLYEYHFVTKTKERVDVINECTAFCLFQIWTLIKDLEK